MEKPPVTKEEKALHTIARLKQDYNQSLSDVEHPTLMETTATFSFTEELLRSSTGHTYISYAQRNAPASEQPDYEHIEEKSSVNKELRDFLNSQLEKEIVLDLGAGVQGIGYIIANESKAAGYIGVEMNYAETLNNRCIEMSGETPFTILQKDLGEVLLNMAEHNEKVKMVIYSGIDAASYSGGIPLEQIWERIAKVMEENGILLLGGNLGWYGDEFGSIEGLKQLFEEIRMDNLPLTIRFYKKK